MRYRLAVAMALLMALGVLLYVLAGGAPVTGGLLALIVACLAFAVVLMFVMRFETSGWQSRIIAVVALLGTLSALLRIPFAAIPNFQPSTYLVICSGYVFGPVAGFAVGALTSIVSNFFLGHGPWTLFQVVAWGLAGASAASFRRLPLHPVWLAMVGIVWAVLFGVIMNVWTWLAYIYPLTMRSFVVTWIASIPFDILHAIGNALFLGLLGVRTIRILERYHGRFSWIRQNGGTSANTDSESGSEQGFD